MAERKKVKKRKPKKRITINIKETKKIKLVAIIVVVLLLIMLAAAQFGGVTFSTVTDYVQTFFAGLGSGDGYPYQINGMVIEDAEITNSDVVLVYDDTVKVLDSTAKELSNTAHKYDHPVMNTNSGRVLLYDEGGKKFRVQSKTRTLYEKEMEYMILTASLGKNGTVAIATRAEDAQSMLTVYNEKEKEVFVWKCAKENIISCDVSDNGKLFVVSVLGVENGSVYSKVYVFDRKKDTPKVSATYKDSAVSSVRFLSNETVFVLGNNMCSVIKKDGKEEKIDVSVNTPYMISISDNNTAVLVLSKYSSTTQKIVSVYNKSGKELFSREIDGLIKSVSTDGKYVGVLTDNNVQIYNMKGEHVGSASVNADAEEVIVTGRNTYVYSADKIERFSSIGDNKKK